MLPRRIPKPPKRASRWRSQAHLKFVRSHICSIPKCGNWTPIEAAHVRNGSGAGMGQKPDDWRAVSLCKDCHDMQHRVGEDTFWRESDVDVEELVAAFIKASPKRHEIEQVQREREASLTSPRVVG